MGERIRAVARSEISRVASGLQLLDGARGVLAPSPSLPPQAAKKNFATALVSASILTNVCSIGNVDYCWDYFWYLRLCLVIDMGLIPPV